MSQNSSTNMPLQGIDPSLSARIELSFAVSQEAKPACVYLATGLPPQIRVSVLFLVGRRAVHAGHSDAEDAQI
jgi:hypothetical protein